MLLLLLFGTLACGQAPEAPTALPSPTPAPWRAPNFVLIVLDDARLNDPDYMANIQAELVAKGVTFTIAYAPTSLCCPSRASILLGMFEHNHGISDNEVRDARGNPQGYAKFLGSGYEQQTIAAEFQRAGYTTMIAGKYFNHYPAQFSETHLPFGWDEVYIPSPQNAKLGYSMRTIQGWETFASDRHDGDIVFEKAREFALRTREPFFAYVTPSAPHIPNDPAPRHENIFEDLQFVKPLAFDEEDISDKPMINGLPRLTRQAETKVKHDWLQRLRTLKSVDDQIPLLIADLARAGRLDNTYIILTSDNGWFLGEHRQTVGKLYPYEAATHMPLIVRGPGIPPGTKLDHPVTLVDIAPTLLDLARRSIPEHMDGISWKPLLSRDPLSELQWRPAVLYELTTRWQAIRTKKYTYIQWTSREPEIYDMQADPGQTENMVWHERPVPERRQLEDYFNILRNCRERSCRP